MNRAPGRTANRSLQYALAALSMLAASAEALAWGDEGHQVVALIAFDRLEPAVKERGKQILAMDDQAFQMRDGRRTDMSFATQATWADYYRESKGHGGEPYQKTHNWHFADIEIHDGSIDEACFEYPELPSRQAASDGAAEDCVVDKITQFKKELGAVDTSPAERLLALKYLLHFVGDVHQPLHSSDDHDAGGNGKRVTAKGIKAGKLHHYWDTEFVLKIPAPSTTPEGIATYLASRITAAKAHQWSSPDPKKWSKESFTIAKRDAYGALPDPDPTRTGKNVTYHLSDDYVSDAVDAVQIQLSKAGVRLADLLNAALR
jgi:hypothetical protein